MARWKSKIRKLEWGKNYVRFHPNPGFDLFVLGWRAHWCGNEKCRDRGLHATVR